MDGELLPRMNVIVSTAFYSESTCLRSGAFRSLVVELHKMTLIQLLDRFFHLILAWEYMLMYCSKTFCIIPNVSSRFKVVCLRGRFWTAASKASLE